MSNIFQTIIHDYFELLNFVIVIYDYLVSVTEWPPKKRKNQTKAYKSRPALDIHKKV